jgi:hypothetical protein
MPGNTERTRLARARRSAATAVSVETAGRRLGRSVAPSARKEARDEPFPRSGALDVSRSGFMPFPTLSWLQVFPPVRRRTKNLRKMGLSLEECHPSGPPPVN